MWCENLTLEQWEEKYENSVEFEYLHGFCHEFVISNYQENDKCIAILEYRDNLLCLIHSCLKRDDKFVDVRGETTEFNDVLDVFDYCEYFVNTYNSLTEFKQLLKEHKIK